MEQAMEAEYNIEFEEKKHKYTEFMKKLKEASKRKHEKEKLYSGKASKKLIEEYTAKNLNYSVLEWLDLNNMEQWHLIIIKSEIYYHCQLGLYELN